MRLWTLLIFNFVFFQATNDFKKSIMRTSTRKAKRPSRKTTAMHRRRLFRPGEEEEGGLFIPARFHWRVEWRLECLG